MRRGKIVQAKGTDRYNVDGALIGSLNGQLHNVSERMGLLCKVSHRVEPPSGSSIVAGEEPIVTWPDISQGVSRPHARRKDIRILTSTEGLVPSCDQGVRIHRYEWVLAVDQQYFGTR